MLAVHYTDACEELPLLEREGVTYARLDDGGRLAVHNESGRRRVDYCKGQEAAYRAKLDEQREVKSSCR